MTEKTDTMTYRTPIGHEINTEHRGLSPSNGDQSGQRSQQGGLARAVGTPQQNDATCVNIEINAGQRRETAQQCDRPPEMDHGRRLGGADGDGRAHWNAQPYPWPLGRHQAARWCPGACSR